MIATTFSEAVPRLLEICEGDGAFCDVVERALLLRDLYGRLRLVLKMKKENERRKLPELETSLKTKLKPWFLGPILYSGIGTPAETKLADELLKIGLPRTAETWREEGGDGWPALWPRNIDLTTSTDPRSLRERWCGHQSLFSKEEWLSGAQSDPPWPLSGQGPAQAIIDPPVTAFASFKGGVGRSTVLSALALRLAMAGAKVVCLDLDLEAPGLGRIMLGEELPREMEGRSTVVDWLLEHAVGQIGEPPLLDVPLPRGSGHAEPPSPGWLRFGPAGRPGPGYVEQLARLDLMQQVFAPDRSRPTSVESALRDLLCIVRAQHQPDHIFIDCRAGLHDLGGMVLSRLCHTAVLVGRRGLQDLDGLEAMLELLARRRPSARDRLVIVHSMVLPANNAAARRAELDEHRQRVYEAFKKSFYRGEAPGVAGTSAFHHPWPVSQTMELQVMTCVCEETPARHIAQSPEFGDLLVRLSQLWAP